MNCSRAAATCTARSRRRLESARARRALIVGVWLLAFSDVRADAGSVARCIHQVGEFGNEIVQACVNDDIAAERALAEYPGTAKAIVARCSSGVEQTGWVLARRCADLDIAAADGLAGYPPEHRPLIGKCTMQLGDEGPARVKACVDREIAAGNAPRRQ
jgi:hypothetical protein